MKASHGHSFPISNFCVGKNALRFHAQGDTHSCSVVGLGLRIPGNTQLRGRSIPPTEERRAVRPSKWMLSKAPNLLDSREKPPPFSGTGIAEVSFREGSENSFPLSVSFGTLFANSFTIHHHLGMTKVGGNRSLLNLG